MAHQILTGVSMALLMVGGYWAGWRDRDRFR